jgi:hypothetical protein
MPWDSQTETWSEPLWQDTSGKKKGRGQSQSTLGLFLWFAGFAVVLLWSGTLMGLWPELTCLSSCVPTTGVVTENDSGKNLRRVHYRYSVAGNPYTGRGMAAAISSAEPGTPITVYYQPGRPHESVSGEPLATIQTVTGGVMLGTAMMPLAIMASYAL